MASVTQIAFQVPDEDLERLDEAVPGEYPSRAAALRAALRDWLERREQAEIDRQLAAGYGLVPEDPDMTDGLATANEGALRDADLNW